MEFFVSNCECVNENTHGVWIMDRQGKLSKFPLAAGTIGGLIMSVIGVFIFLPVLTLKRNK